MRFYVRKRRQAPAIIIVALIDILIVLLIFLMTTTVFKQQPALKLSLPESSEAAPLIVSVDIKGILRVGVDATPVTYEILKQKLSEAVAKTPDLRLAISADKDAPWGQVVRVMDAAKEANLKQGNVKAFIKQAAKS